MITSYIVLKDRLKIFAENHYQIKKFGGEFQSEINNFATENEKYPILYISPINQRVYENTTEFDMDLYVMDLIDDNRANINTIVSDTNLILNDLYNYYKEGYDDAIDVIGNPSLSPLNNQLLDYAAGWVMRITFTVDNYTACSIPFIDGIPYVVSNDCQTTSFKYLTCETVTGCTSLQEYVQEQIDAASGTTVTGFTYNSSNNTLTIGLSDSTTFDAIISEMSGMTFNGPVSATTYYGDGSNLTGISTQDTFVTGGTYFTGGTIVFDYNVGGGFQVTGLTEDLDAAIAGLAETDELTIELDIATNKIRLKDDVAAPPSGTRIFQGNVEFVGNVTGSTFYGDGSNLTGIPDIYVTGATYDNNTTILTLTRNDNTQITASGWTSNDTFVTGFTNSNNVFTILDNNGQSYSTTLNALTGLTINGTLSATTYYGNGSNLTGISDTSVTGFTFNTGNYELELLQSNNNNLNVDLSILASDMTITGGTYNSATGTATFTNNTGGTFDVTGFLTGFTDIYTTGATYDNLTGAATFTRNDGNNYTLNGLYTGYTLTDTDIVDALGYTPLSACCEDIFVTGATYNPSSKILTITRNDGVNITASGWTSGGGGSTFITGFTNNNNVFTISDNDGHIVSTTLNTLTGLTINGNLDVTTIDEVNSIDFSTTATTTNAVGRLKWNDADGTLDLGLKGGNVTLQIGQEQVARVVNKTGANLLESQYRVVRIRSVAEGGSQGQRLAVVLAQANNDANSVDTLGIVTENINVNQEGFITTSGLVNGINTTGSLQGETWVDGDLLYLSPTTPGFLTKVKPIAPQHTIIMGYVVYAHINQGKIFVKVDNGYELNELHNVRIINETGGDTLQYNATTDVWENSKPYWTIDLMDASSVEFYAVQDVKINTITNVVGSPTITIADDGVTYTLTNTILSGSKITVSSNIQSVVKLNITY